MGTNKEIRILIKIAVLVVATGLLCWLIQEKKKYRREYGVSHLVARTLTGFKFIGIALRVYVEEKGHLPKALYIEGSEEARAKALYDELIADEVSRDWINVFSNDNAGTFRDKFGKVLHFRVKVEVWSDGPNGANEWGKGDDLCATIVFPKYDIELKCKR